VVSEELFFDLDGARSVELTKRVGWMTLAENCQNHVKLKLYCGVANYDTSNPVGKISSFSNAKGRMAVGSPTPQRVWVTKWIVASHAWFVGLNLFRHF
jgi:hypothetical protein